MSARGRKAIAAELEVIYRDRGGLDPAYVEKWARKHPGSAIHERLEWDDGKAGMAYRIWQIRALIVQVEVSYEDGKKRQAYVSLKKNRGKKGYVALAKVLSSAEQRRMLLQEALDEYKHVGAKYHSLRELARVRDAVAKVDQEVHKVRRARRA